ncbi:uroporphyrinogen-III C-methyltransferase [Metabacillus niabensis]|uniref:uroporphyrinogen-III C-methyltransferase n=1 Tax=Metabacillus niabensis TaxID=324854 RepID=A0ABT9Z5T3_9BACI|nr:uroporphyrinogen-III C-methyltransferase [Metabacillus niabensis]MDQ0226655.1 uroporphyrinogen III methyltransferase/synthase [Metabacillus niabensis]
MGEGKVYLVGAGPGDSELITVKGMEALKRADVILYDRLVNPKLLRFAPANCELIYCGKLPTRHFMRQEEINHVLVDKALEGLTVVRLKGGDPSIFGRVGEEAEALANAHISYEIVPGITSGIAAPLYAGIPVTHRDYAGSFAMVTAHDKSKNGKPDIDWEGLARGVQTIAFYMGISNLEHICENLIKHGKSADTPVIIIRWGTWSRQESVVGTLSTISEKVRSANIINPAITLVGDIVASREKLKWFEKKPLFGKQILSVSGCVDEAGLANNIEAQGADVIEFPKWKTSERYLEVKIMNNLENYKRILFTTTASVSYFFSLLRKHQIDIREIRASLYCKDFATIQVLEERGLFAKLENEMTKEGKLLLVGSKEKADPLWMLEYKYGEYDYADVYQSIIDERYIPVIKRAVEDASITSILFSSKDAVQLFMKEAEKCGLSNLLEDEHVELLCVTNEAKEAAKNHGLKAKILDYFEVTYPDNGATAIATTSL